MNVQLPENPREHVGANNPPADVHFLDARIVLLGAEFLQFTFGDLDNLFVSGKARAAKRRMGFRRVLSYCLDGLVGQEGQAHVIGLCRDTIMDDQHAVKRWCVDDEFAEWVEHVRLGMVGFIHCRLNKPEFEERLAHWVAKNPKLKQKRDARALLTQAAKAMSREALGVLSRVMISESSGKRLRQEAFREIESGLKECFAEGFITDAEPKDLKYAPRKPDAQRQVAPTKQGALVYVEAVSLGLVSKPKRRGE